MQLYIDADACPKAIKVVLYRAAERMKVRITFVANQRIRTAQSPYLFSKIVPQGADAADDWIVEQAKALDLVVTADIPLASRVIAKGAFALDPRGEFMTEDNIGPRLSLRDFFQDMRDNGMITGGPAEYSRRDLNRFSNELNAFLTRNR